MKIYLHDEGSYETAARFLDGWISVAVQRLSAILGDPTRPADVNVVLSTTVEHARRFPPEKNDVGTLLGAQGEDPDGENPEVPLAERFRHDTYAHGVTTLCDLSQGPPGGIPAGAPVIYLDIPTIERLASEHHVSNEAMLSRVTLHELSHLLRGHAEREGKATHGFICEGDAQRDTWQALADLLADPEWEYLAREARVAQVRLAATQPPAYRQFGHSSPDTDRWIRGDPAPPAEWTLHPARGLLPLSRPAVVEVPFFSSVFFGKPTVGDHVYLLGDGLAVGPWVVVGRAKRSYVGHPTDQRGIEAYKRKNKYEKDSVPDWLHLRPSRDIRAGVNPDGRLNVGIELFTKKMEREDDVALLRRTVTGAAHEVLEALAIRQEHDHEANVHEVQEMLRAVGKPIPPEPDNPYDPYDD